MGRYGCSDEELLYMVRQKDEIALDILISKFSNGFDIMCRNLLKKQGRNDYDDAKQMAMLGFLSAIETYRNDKEASFRYFAKMCAEREVRSMLRKERVKGLYAHHRSISLDQSISEEEGAYLLDFVENTYPEYNPSWSYEYNRLEALCNEEYKSLGDEEKRIFELWSGGMSYKEIAQEVNIKVKTVDNILQKVRKKLNMCMKM